MVRLVMGNCVGVTLSFSKKTAIDLAKYLVQTLAVIAGGQCCTLPTHPTLPLTLPSQTSRICTVLSENVQCVLARQLNNSSFTLCVIHWILSVKFCLHIPKLPQTHRLSLHNTANVQVMLNSICSPILILFMFCVPFMF